MSFIWVCSLQMGIASCLVMVGGLLIEVCIWILVWNISSPDNDFISYINAFDHAYYYWSLYFTFTGLLVIVTLPYLLFTTLCGAVTPGLRGPWNSFLALMITVGTVKCHVCCILTIQRSLLKKNCVFFLFDSWIVYLWSYLIRSLLVIWSYFLTVQSDNGRIFESSNSGMCHLSSFPLNCLSP